MTASATTTTRLAKHRGGRRRCSGRHLCDRGPYRPAVGRIGRGPFRPWAVTSGDRPGTWRAGYMAAGNPIDLVVLMLFASRNADLDVYMCVHKIRVKGNMHLD